jgi:hypothetical protein
MPARRDIFAIYEKKVFDRSRLVSENGLGLVRQNAIHRRPRKNSMFHLSGNPSKRAISPRFVKSRKCSRSNSILQGSDDELLKPLSQADLKKYKSYQHKKREQPEQQFEINLAAGRKGSFSPQTSLINTLSESEVTMISADNDVICDALAQSDFNHSEYTFDMHSKIQSNDPNCGSFASDLSRSVEESSHPSQHNRDRTEKKPKQVNFKGTITFDDKKLFQLRDKNKLSGFKAGNMLVPSYRSPSQRNLLEKKYSLYQKVKVAKQRSPPGGKALDASGQKSLKSQKAGGEGKTAILYEHRQQLHTMQPGTGAKVVQLVRKKSPLTPMSRSPRRPRTKTIGPMVIKSKTVFGKVSTISPLECEKLQIPVPVPALGMGSQSDLSEASSKYGRRIEKLKMKKGKDGRCLRRCHTIMEGHVWHTSKVTEQEQSDGTKMVNDYIIVRKLGK